MDNRKSRTMNRKLKKRTKSFTEALKEKYCVDDEPTFDFIIVSPKRKNAAGAELAHLRTVVLNEMDVSRADIPRAGLASLCPNVVDLDLANNLFESWSELINILASLPRVKYVNVSRNRLKLDENETLPVSSLTVENLALNNTGSSIEEVVRLSKLMPSLKELHLCGNDYSNLGELEQNIADGAFSSLECLRLNNNGITNWSEIWKLRFLPQLKYLILSGNPIRDIFYHNNNDNRNSNNNNNDSSANNDNRTDCEENLDHMDTSADYIICEDIAVEAEEEDVCDVDDIAVEVDVNDVVEETPDVEFTLGNDGYEEEEEEEEEEEDLYNYDFDSSIDGRPVSRFGFHQDAEVLSSEENSDTEGEHTDASGAATGNIDIPQTGSQGGQKKVHNINYNNSRNSRSARSCTFDDTSVGSADSILLPGFPLPIGPAQLLTSDSDPGEGDDDPGDWPRLAAEQFLYDLIDQLDLEESAAASSEDTSLPQVTTTSTVPTTSTLSSSTVSTTSTSWYNSNAVYSPPTNAGTGEIIGSQSHTVSTRVTPTHTSFASTVSSSINRNQNAATSEDNAEDKSEDSLMSKILSTLNADDGGSDTEENLFAAVYSDDDFIPRSVSMRDDDLIPRSVSMLDDDVHDSNFSPPCFPNPFRDLSSNSSRAKRCLFDASVRPSHVDSNSKHSSYFISNRPTSSFNPSFEVNPSRFLPFDNKNESIIVPEVEMSANSRLTSDKLNLNPAPSGQSESDSCSDCEAEQHSLTAALRQELSDLATQAINHSESTTSHSTTNEDGSFSMTYTQGARVVVTGLTNNEITSDQSSTRSCDPISNNEEKRSNSCPQCTQNQVQHALQQTPHYMNATEDVHLSCNMSDSFSRPTVPFHQLQMLCLSSASLGHWEHLDACTAFPVLHNIRLKNNPLYSSVSNDDKRKLYIASLPKVTVLNGGEVTRTEREKAENFYLRYFQHESEKPELYHTLVAKHGVPVKLVDIDLSAGYQEWATLTFKCDGMEDFTRRLHLTEPVSRLRTVIAQVLRVPKWSFLMRHHPCGPSHPESEREIVELRCEALPMSRFDFAEGDEIIIDMPERGN